MPFTNYAAIGEVARAYQITLHDNDFVVPVDRPVARLVQVLMILSRFPLDSPRLQEISEAY